MKKSKRHSSTTPPMKGYFKEHLRIRRDDRNCPFCHETLQVTIIEPRYPKPGDFGICQKCGCPLVFTDDGEQNGEQLLSTRVAVDADIDRMTTSEKTHMFGFMEGWRIQHRAGGGRFN